jgi:hypothetical protein
LHLDVASAERRVPVATEHIAVAFYRRCIHRSSDNAPSEWLGEVASILGVLSLAWYSSLRTPKDLFNEEKATNAPVDTVGVAPFERFL